MPETEVNQGYFNDAVTLIKEYFSNHKEKEFIISVSIKDYDISWENKNGK